MAVMLEGSLPALVASSAELAIIHALATSPELASTVREQQPEGFAHLVEAGVVSETGLSAAVEHMMVGALSPEQSINIVLLRPDDYVSATAFLSQRGDSVLTSAGGEEYRLYGADRAETLYQISEVLSLNAGVPDEMISPVFPTGFVDAVLAGQSGDCDAHLKAARGVDEAFARAVGAGQWLVRIIRREMFEDGQAQLAGAVIAVTVGTRLFVVTMTADDEGHRASMLQPMSLWAEVASWFA